MTAGTFVSAMGGTFDSDIPGTFESATGGTFNPLLSGNGWLCNTYSNTDTKFAQISEISNRLGLGLKVELI